MPANEDAARAQAAAQDARLDRIESKIDAMAQAIISLARVEERQAAQADGQNRLEVRLDTLESRVARLETDVANRGVGLGIASQFFWKVAAPMISAAVAWLFATGGIGQ